jgi:hypothetical protein
VTRTSLPGLRALAGFALFTACGGNGSQGPNVPTKSGTAVDERGGDDRSRCDYKGRADREVIETAGPGALQPNVRRVFAIVGDGEDARKVLLCREVDTNLDGMKDVVRTYNDKGEALHEQADSNYNGKIDTWISFARGRIAKVEIDTNGDGRPDETRFYIDGKLSRVQRDRNFDGKADVWEIYEGGRLQRMGIDLDFDGHVDRWDRDEIAMRLAEREEEQEEKPESDAPTPDAGAASPGDAGVADAYVSPRNR